MTNHREPWLAVIGSRFWPGLGQVYGGAWLRGGAIAVLSLGLALVGLLGLLGSFNLTPWVGLVSLALMLIVNLWSWFDAYWVTRRRNSAEFETARQGGKDPLKAAFLTSLFPGIGHLYIKRYVWGSVLIAIALITSITPLALIVWPFALGHVYWATPPVETLEQRPSHKSGKKLLWVLLLAWLLPLLLSIVSAFTLRTFVAEARYIPSGAMEPTLQVNDRLIVDKVRYRFQEPQRGDIVVFQPTEMIRQQGISEAFIKRIIGLPGETVVVKEGKVFVDGKPLDEPYVLEAPSYVWTAKNLGMPEVIPPGQYFVLGDNRNNSFDSTFWGYVPRDLLVGQATQRFWPMERVGAIE